MVRICDSDRQANAIKTDMKFPAVGFLHLPRLYSEVSACPKLARRLCDHVAKEEDASHCGAPAVGEYALQAGGREAEVLTEEVVEQLAQAIHAILWTSVQIPFD